jgi:hypothetical protein
LNLTLLLDLCTLCEAVVLLDQVAALEAADDHPFPLAERLEQEGLYRTFRPALSRDELRRLAFQLPDELASRVILPGTDHRPPQQRRDAGLLPVRDDAPASLDDLLAQVDRMVAYSSAGETASERAYRSNGYLIVAAAHGLDYFPDFERGSFTAGTLQKVYRSLPMQLYERVAQSLNESLTGGDVVSEWSAISTIPIPPVAALVFDRATSLADVPDAVLHVRADFARYRRHFANFKAELAAADTIKQRAGLRQKYQMMLAEASGPHRESVSLTEMLNLTEKMVKVAAGPTVATSYGALLLTQPIDWIRRWWQRRPLTFLFRMDSKLPRLSTYRRLVEHGVTDMLAP